jgi:hypothetical protein
MAASVVSDFGPVFSGGAGPAVLFPGRSSRDREESAPAGYFESQEQRAAAGAAAPAELERSGCPMPPVASPPARRASPRGRRFEHGARPLSPAPSRPRSARPANRRLATLPSSQRGFRAQVARSVPRKLRLTRRGQLVLVLVVIAAVYGAFGLGRAGAGAESGAVRAHQVVVQQGDSLWAIATRVLPNQDPRDVVGKIKTLNHLQGSAVEAGQTLQLP